MIVLCNDKKILIYVTEEILCGYRKSRILSRPCQTIFVRAINEMLKNGKVK